MARIICDIYIKKDKKIWGDDIQDEFNQRILAVNNMYGWLYEKGILEKASFEFKDYEEASYFALDAKDLLLYRSEMEKSGVTGAALATRHIFDEPYTPCSYSGAIELSWTMSSYRSVDGCVDRSWECGLVKNLDTTGIYDVAEVRDAQGVRAAVHALFSQFNWKPTLSELSKSSLASRLVSFYKDFDFYDFTDKMEIGQSEEDVITDMEQQLDSPKSTTGILERLREIYQEDNLTPAQKVEADRLIQDLSGLLSKTLPKVSLDDKISSAASRSGEPSNQAEQKSKDQEPER